MKIFKKALVLVAGLILSVSLFSCENKSNTEAVPGQSKEYVQFQKDSVKLCTKDARIAESAVLGAFDRVPENNGYFKKDKVTLEYNDSLQYWVGVVTYHVDRNNTYYQATKTFYVKYWYEMEEGNPKNAKLFYKVWE